MADYKKSQYNISLNSQGYLLDNTPQNPARRVVQSPIYGNRFAMGDRDYTDFTFWWFWAQTDWSGGFKDEKKWLDDAKYYYSTNLDVFSEYGAIKLASGLTELEDFVEDIRCGGYGQVNGSNKYYIGTDNDAAGKPRVYESSDGTTWTNISDGEIHTNQNDICYTAPINDLLWVGTRGTGDSTVVLSYNGSAWTDYSSAILAAMTGSYLKASSAIVSVGTDIYLGAEDGINDRVSLMKYDGTDWTELANWVDATTIYDMINYRGDVYYLKGRSGGFVELRVWDVSAAADALVQKFTNDSLNNKIGHNKYLQVLGGKLIVTIPNKEIWEYDEITLERIWERDDKKNSIGTETVGYITRGGLLHDNKIFWGNLVYDGTYFFNNKKNTTDSTAYVPYPVFSAANLGWVSLEDITKLYSDSNYKSGTDKNFLIFNEMSEISTVNKLAYNFTVIFDKLVENQDIKIEYSTDDRSTWTELGTITYAVDGGTIVHKEFFFADNTTFRKMWFKLYLNGGGSNTPTVRDISMAYLPLPAYRQRWVFRIQCYNDLVLLDGKEHESKRGEELRNLLKTVWKTKDVIVFQDVDFSETLLNGALTAANTTITVDSTNRFPEQGIIRIENEKIKYTGKTATTFTGCTRGYEETVAASHTDNTACSNSYKVIVINYEESTPVGAKPRINEYLVQLELQEI